MTPGGLKPWDVVAGDTAALFHPNAIAVDKTYLEDLGITGLGDTAQIDTTRVRVVAMTEGIRSFTTAPYVFMPLARAREIQNLTGDQTTFLLVKLASGADRETVRRALVDRLPSDVEVLATETFRERSLAHWLFSTGAGIALIGGAVLGTLVGTVIVAQTLYSSTKDHLNEFATLRALGARPATYTR